MIPFYVFLVATLLLRLAGATFVPALGSWPEAVRFGLVPLFLLTASAHWGKRRPDLVRMIPPSFPNPEGLVTLTGMLEIAGAVGLLIPSLVPWAALGLTLLLLAVFPANIHAARHKLTIDGHPVPALGLRTLIQVLFLAATILVAVTHFPR